MADSANVKVKDFKVAIVGGGISGLTCAIALKQAGVSAEVFEAAVSGCSLECCIFVSDGSFRRSSRK